MSKEPDTTQTQLTIESLRTVIILGYTEDGCVLRLYLSDEAARIDIEPKLKGWIYSLVREGFESCRTDRTLSRLKMRTPKENEEYNGAFLISLTAEELDSFLKALLDYEVAVGLLDDLKSILTEAPLDSMKCTRSGTVEQLRKAIYKEMHQWVIEYIAEKIDPEAAKNYITKQVEKERLDQLIAKKKRELEQLEKARGGKNG